MGLLLEQVYLYMHRVCRPMENTANQRDESCKCRCSFVSTLQHNCMVVHVNHLGNNCLAIRFTKVTSGLQFRVCSTTRV